MTDAPPAQERHFAGELPASDRDVIEAARLAADTELVADTLAEAARQARPTRHPL